MHSMTKSWVFKGQAWLIYDKMHFWLKVLLNNKNKIIIENERKLNKECILLAPSPFSSLWSSQFAYLSDCISLACNLTLGRPKYRRRYNPKAQLESWTRLFRYCCNCLWAFDAVSRVGHGGLHNEDGRKEEEKKGAGREERIKNKWPVCDLTLFIAVVFIKLAKIFRLLLIQMVGLHLPITVRQ